MASPAQSSYTQSDDNHDAPEDYSFQSEAPSAAYDTDDLDLPSSSSPGNRSVDSLADASFSEVEARALEFLADAPPPPPGHEHQPQHPPPTAFDLLADFPLKKPSSPADEADAHASAVRFLRKQLDDADDWTHPTPPAFDLPLPLDLSSRSGGGGEGTAAGGGWSDQAFNLERFQVADVPEVDAWAHEDPLMAGEQSRFGDAGDFGS
ncbi:hypothetical protein JCM8547_003939 [Rhodosporidiobolus lusitaniae]